MGAGSKKEVERMAVEVFADGVALQVREQEAESCGLILLDFDRAGEVLDEHGTGKAVFAGARAVRSHFNGHADIGLLLEPQNMEDASAILELGKENLDGMNGMQELEAI